MKSIYREIRRATKGNTYISSGILLDPTKRHAPECDTIFLKLCRNGHEDLKLYITPEEALIIARMLSATVDASMFSTGD